MLCPRCYTEINDRAKFCHRCGLQINTQPNVQDSKKNMTTIWIVAVIVAAALLYGWAFLIRLAQNLNPMGISKVECKSLMYDYAYS
jgi:uncharacterized protein (DUF983 family)